MRTIARHWREYAIEASCLAIFMMAAVAFAVLLQHPASPFARIPAGTRLSRVPMGLAMGLTAVALIYSPAGRRSGAHMNPAVTLTFFRLGKISGTDAAAYIAAQFAGGAAGISLAALAFGPLASDAAVNYVATQPGSAGIPAAFVAEVAISFVLMLTVLLLSSDRRLAPLTGLAAGALVAGFITVEAPVSGMSMNPARTWASALFAGGGSLWIYFTAPPLGMLAAAEAFVRSHGQGRVPCAKLHHAPGACIFYCGYPETSA